MGYDSSTNTWSTGLLVATDGEIKETLIQLLMQHDCSREKAESILHEQYFYADLSNADYIQPIDDPVDIISRLKRNNIKVAVCTSDSRIPSEQSMKNLRLLDMIDTMLCGDDVEMSPKPDPHNVLHVCDRVGVGAGRAMMVGDTAGDVEMGRYAGVWASVGVLSGVGNQRDLSSADYIVPSIKHILPLVLNDEWVYLLYQLAYIWLINDLKSNYIDGVFGVAVLRVLTFCPFNHRGQVTHFCIWNLSIISSDNDLAPVRCQAIISSNSGILWIWPLGKISVDKFESKYKTLLCSVIWIKIQSFTEFSLKEIDLIMLSLKFRPFCQEASELTLGWC